MAEIFTQKGEEWAVDQLDVGTQYVGWGTSATTAVKGDTNLGTAATEARVAGTRSQVLADKLQWLATITADGGKTIKEVGLFDAAGSGSPPSGGNLIIHANHTDAVMSAAGDKVDYTITLEMT